MNQASDLEVIKSIHGIITESGGEFAFLKERVANELHDKGFLVINADIAKNGNVAVKLTEQANVLLSQQNEPAPKTLPDAPEEKERPVYTIERNVEIHKRASTGKRVRASKYPFGDLEVDASFHVPYDSDDEDVRKKQLCRLRSAYSHFSKRKNKDWKVSVLRVTDRDEKGEGIRVIRTI